MRPGFEEYFHARYFNQEFIRLVAHVRRLGASREAAEDAAQQAFTEAYRQWEKIDNSEAWLRKVAARMYLGSADDVMLTELTDDMAPGKSPDLAENLEQSELVLAALRILPLNQRVVMAWAYDGYTPTEIARAFGMKPENVRKSLQRAREQLKVLLARGGQGRNT
jgi:RNA polymerase sigma factor (sigma-70 family)